MSEKNQVTFVHVCNHEEADTRLVLYAIIQNTDMVIVFKDTDVLILLLWAFTKLQVVHKWFFKFDNEKFVEVGSICKCLGPRICCTGN